MLTTARAAAVAVPLSMLVVVAIMTIAPPHIALAHSRYKASSPGIGEIAQDAPPQVDITFTQSIQKLAGTYDLAVTRDGGGSVTSGPATLEDQDRSKMSV